MKIRVINDTPHDIEAVLVRVSLDGANTTNSINLRCAHTRTDLVYRAPEAGGLKHKVLIELSDSIRLTTVDHSGTTERSVG